MSANVLTTKCLAAFRNGYTPLPADGKVPTLPNWAAAQIDADEIVTWAERYPTAENMGLRCGTVVALDIDVMNENLVLKLIELAHTMLGATPLEREGKSPKTLLVYRTEVPFKKLRTSVFTFADGSKAHVEFLADGQQFIGSGIHPETRQPYRWKGKSPKDVPAEDLPAVTQEACNTFLTKAEDLLCEAGGKAPERKPPSLTVVKPAEAAGENRAFVEAALNGLRTDLANAQEGERNNVLFKTAARVFEFVAAGAVSESAAVSELTSIATTIGLEARAVAKTIESAKRHGLQKPASIPAPRPNGARSLAASAALAVAPDANDEPSMEPPRPLMRAVDAPEPFPHEALGSILAAAAQGIHERVRAHPAICGQSVLAVANYAAQAHADVMLPSGQVRPISLYFVSIADSGDRKSSADAEALWPVYRRQDALRENYEAKFDNYQLDKTAWEAAVTNAKKSQTKNGKAAVRRALDEIGPEPKPPLKPGLALSDTTFEGLFKSFLHGQPSMALFTTEGGQFIGGHGMADEAKLRMASGLSKLWDGAYLDRNRSGDGSSFIAGRRLASHLMVQPGVADLLLSDEAMADQGLLSRMLCTAPESLAGTRFWAEPSEQAHQAIKDYGAHVLALLERTLPIVPGRLNELAPPVLRLTDAARRLWIKFQNHVESQLGQEGELAPIKSRANKMPEIALRIAATLTVFEDPDAGFVDDGELERGILIANHYIAEALRLVGAAKVGPELRDAQLTIDWLHREWKGDLVSLPDLYQRGPKRIRTQAAAALVVDVLTHHGWLAKVAGPAVINGTTRRDVWRIWRPER